MFVHVSMYPSEIHVCTANDVSGDVCLSASEIHVAVSYV